MITNHYKNYLQAVLSGGTASLTDVNKNIRELTGSNIYYSAYQYLPAKSGLDRVNLSPTASCVGIVLGIGTTAPTVNDYKLESYITTGINCLVTNTFGADDDGGSYAKATITVNNTSSGSITISEVGYHTLAYYGDQSYSACPVLVDRTLLESPITIPAGGIGQVVYTLKFGPFVPAS